MVALIEIIITYYWASVSEPHTSDVNTTFPLYYHHYGMYVVLYILSLVPRLYWRGE